MHEFVCYVYSFWIFFFRVLYEKTRLLFNSFKDRVTIVGRCVDLIICSTKPLSASRTKDFIVCSAPEVVFSIAATPIGKIDFLHLYLASKQWFMLVLWDVGK